MLLYAACSANEADVDWGNNFVTIDTDLVAAKKHFTDHLQQYIARAKELLGYKRRYSILMCLSDQRNFRKLLLPSYKSNRTKRKPCGYYALRKWVEDTYKCLCIPWLEADDCIGLNSGKNTCIISGDKDMSTIPGKFYNFSKDKYTENTVYAADWRWLYQTLIGDKTDGYNGLVGIGPKSAEKILGDNANWKKIVAAYENKGQSDALVQARIARILRHGEYKAGKVFLWNPDNTKEELCLRSNL